MNPEQQQAMDELREALIEAFEPVVEWCSRKLNATGAAISRAWKRSE